MNRTTIFLASILMPLLSARSEPAKIQPAKIDLIAAAPGNVFRIEAGEAVVDGSVIKRVVLGKNTAVVTYFNRTTKSVYIPTHQFRLIDAYGFEIASFKIESSIDAGKVLAINQDLKIQNVGKLLEFSTVALPADWEVPVYLVIEDLPAQDLPAIEEPPRPIRRGLNIGVSPAQPQPTLLNSPP